MYLLHTMFPTQKLEDYSQEQHATWNFLYDRQKAHLHGKASQLYLDMLDSMSDTLTRTSIPMVEDMAFQLKKSTGWSIEIVPGLIPPSEFFLLLSQKNSVHLLGCVAKIKWITLKSPICFTIHLVISRL